MTNNKQSSIEWLINFFEAGVTSSEEWLQAKEQAKAMHKEEIVDFLKWIEGTYSFGNVHGLWYERINTSREYTTEELLNKYYNETFGGNNEQ